MRVIAGVARGTKLLSLDGLHTRPTTDRIKETIFNIIHNDLYDCDFLDVFSGSGAIGIEAISRGAKKAVFIDNSEEACKIIKQNLLKTKFLDKACVVKKDAVSAFKNLDKDFDFVFLDPPYKNQIIKDVLQYIVDNNILKNKGLLVLEQDFNTDILNIKNLKVIKIKEFKNTKIVFYRWEDYL